MVARHPRPRRPRPMGHHGNAPAAVRPDLRHRKRYAHLALVLAALSRAGIQVALSDLADVVAADANRIDGLGLDTGRGPDRAAFVDVVTWLEDRGALRLADGSARAWADDPGRAEALYDIDRDVVIAVYRSTRVLHHVDSASRRDGRSSSGRLEHTPAPRDDHRHRGWAELHVDRITAAQAAYDAAHRK
jgi:uncharacterized protein (TIGR02678 family)